METTQSKKWLMIALILFGVGFVLWFILGQSEENKVTHIDKSDKSQKVSESNSREPGVPLSGTDESMEMNASNEADRGGASEITIGLPGGGQREATASEYYQIEGADIELAFDHVAPGQYSEVYGVVHGYPGTEVEVLLSGPGVTNTATRTVMIGETGFERLTWRITQYGTYTAVTTPLGFDNGKTATIEVN